MYESIVFQDVVYQEEAAGWVDGVYYPRMPHVEERARFLERQGGLWKLHSRVWQEIEETGFGIYYYEETTELVTRLEGSNYLVRTVLVNPGSRAYTCHIRLNNVVKQEAVTVEPGEEKEVSFIACMTDGAFVLRFAAGAVPDIHSEVVEGDVYLRELDIVPQEPKQKRDKPHVFLISDSTVQSYGERSYPQTGWGQVLYRFFQGAEEVREYPAERSSYGVAKTYELPEIAIENRAIAGRSARSFYDEGKLDQALEVLCPGDFMFLQFAHNDNNKLRPNRYISLEEYPLFLQRYVDACERRGAQCVFVTPVTMRCTDGAGRFVICFDDYRGKMRELAERTGIPLLDLGERSTAYLNQIGEAESKKIYLWAAEGQYPGGAYAAGVSDNAHLQEYGAMVYANLVVQLILEYQADGRLDVLKRLAAPEGEEEIKAMVRKPCGAPDAVKGVMDAGREGEASCGESMPTDMVNGFVAQEVSVDNGRGSFLLNWSPVDGAVSYAVYARKEGEGALREVRTVTRQEKEAYATLPFSAEAGAVWQYCVAAVFEGGRKGALSRTVEIDLRG